jgi:putative Mg2+ transporter-C (MgtC) family protein
MHETIEWPEIALRLALATAAGAALGFDRSERGRPAGLRTTMLVCLAAAIAMIQTNMLLSLKGKTPESFAVMDFMRLPLGILTGMGFIGAGAIVRRGNRTEGVTTAATLWVVTVIGLCLGGGQIGLGLSGVALALFVLEGLRRLDRWVKPGRTVSLLVTLSPEGPSEEELRAEFTRAGYAVISHAASYHRLDSSRQRRALRWSLRASESTLPVQTPSFVEAIASKPGVANVRWNG